MECDATVWAAVTAVPSIRFSIRFDDSNNPRACGLSAEASAI